MTLTKKENTYILVKNQSLIKKRFFPIREMILRKMVEMKAKMIIHQEITLLRAVMAEALAEAVALEVDSAADIAAADSADLITIPRIITILTVISGVPAGVGAGVGDADVITVPADVPAA